jgi:uncharacterized protein YaiE (UPF0345 family)
MVMTADLVTGPSGLSALNTNLIDGTVNGWYDVSTFNSGTIQIIGSAGISAGAVTFECTNDTTLANAGNLLISSVVATNAIASSISPAASSLNTYTFPIGTKYIRARISTAFVGGTVQSVLALSNRIAVVPQSSAVSNIDNIWYQESVTGQAGAATLTGTARDIGVASATNHRFSAFNAQVLTDQSGTLRIEASNDNSTWHPATANVALVAASSGFALQLSIPVIARYHRAVMVNGATLQTRLLFNTSYTAA